MDHLPQNAQYSSVIHYLSLQFIIHGHRAKSGAIQKLSYARSYYCNVSVESRVQYPSQDCIGNYGYTESRMLKHVNVVAKTISSQKSQ